MKETFILYTEYAKHIKLLNMEQRGVLFSAIISYETDEELPEMDAVTQMAFSFIKEDLDRNKSNYQKKVDTNRENGKKGGRPSQTEEPKKPNGYFENPKKPNGFEEEPKKPNGYFENPGDGECDLEGECEGDGERIFPPDPPTDAEEAENIGLKEFLARHGNVIVDNCSTASLDLDYGSIDRAFSASAYLGEKPHELSWVAKNAERIIRGEFRYKRSGAPPNGKGDLQLWQELVKALSAAREETDYGALTYRMQDEASKERMGELYRGLSREITEYFDPNSFLELCGMDDNDLKFERARFLKALPELRQKIAEVQDGA